MLLGIDFGSSSCKGVLFSANGDILSKEAVDYTTDTIGEDGCEMDAEVFFDAFCSVVRRIAAQGTVAAIGISSHGETVIPIGKDASATGPALMNSDNRGIRHAERLEQTLTKEKIYQICGLPVHPMYSLPKICWFRENRPEQFHRTVRFCAVPGYILARLGMEPLVDHTLASRFMAFDIVKQDWSDEILSAAGLERGLLCSTAPAGTVAGEVPKSVAADLGLKEGVPVILAGHDQPCGAFGAGLVSHGSAISAGSYECLCVVDRQPAQGQKALAYHFNTYCHVCDGAFITLAFFPAALCMNWFSSLLYGNSCGQIGPDALYGRIFSEIERLKHPSGLLITPHLIGACNPGWDPLARGGVYGLHPGIKAADIMKGVLEGIACELKLNLDALEEVGVTTGDLLIHGGNARRDAVVQLRSDVTGRRLLRLKDLETGCRGAAMLAGMGKNVFTGYDDAAAGMRTEQEQFVPEEESQREYQRQFQQYQTFYSAVSEL